jgi:Ni/Co efflux regulator RcnB
MKDHLSRSEVMKKNRILVFLAAVAMAASLAIWSASQSKVEAQERQPHMQAALQHLKEAQEELREAEHDKGGHRANATKLVEQAIAEVDAGIHYADKH